MTEPMQNKEQSERVRGRSRRRGSQQSPEERRPASEERVTGESRLDSGRSRRKAEAMVKPDPEDYGNGKPGGKKAAVIAGCVALGILVAAGGAYAVMGQKYRKVFFPKTIINGMDASGRSVEEIKQMIASGIDGYSLVLETRGGGEERISGAEIGLHPEYDGSLETLLGAQEPLRWGIDGREEKEYTIGTMMAYDQQKLDAAVSGLACLDPANVTEPADAKMSEYIDGVGYQIIPEEQGSLIKEDVLMTGVQDAILNISDRLVLEDLDVYVKPQVTSDNPELTAQVESWNKYVQTTVTHRFGSTTEVLDGSTIHQWLYDDGTGKAALDGTRVKEYVRQLAKKHNTAYEPKKLKTSYGSTVTITGGPYGWRMNESAEVEALTGILQSGESQEREPVYLQKAQSHDGPDYGDTYVEINLTAQHLYFYKNGKLLVEADFVSGNESRGWSTPAGAYPLTYKQRDATLKGENYATPVSYWMPFNGNIGMHDAGWRSSFGGSLYKTGGSHGCVNLPPSAAKTIYENIEAGMPVLCYHLSGTEQKSASGAKPQETKPAETKPAETKPAESNPAESRPTENKPATTPSGGQVVEEKPAGGTTPNPGGSTGSGGAATTPGGSMGNGGTATTPGGSAGSGGTTTTPGGSTGNGGTTPNPGGSTGSGGATPTPGGSTTPGGTSGGASTTPGGGAASSPGGSAGPGGAGGNGGTTPSPGGGSTSGGPGAQSGTQSSSGVVSAPGQ